MGFLSKLHKTVRKAALAPLKKDPIAKKVLGSKVGQKLAKADPALRSAAKSFAKKPAPSTGMASPMGRRMSSLATPDMARPRRQKT